MSEKMSACLPELNTESELPLLMVTMHCITHAWLTRPLSCFNPRESLLLPYKVVAPEFLSQGQLLGHSKPTDFPMISQFGLNLSTVLYVGRSHEPQFFLSGYSGAFPSMMLCRL